MQRGKNRYKMSARFILSLRYCHLLLLLTLFLRAPVSGGCILPWCPVQCLLRFWTNRLIDVRVVGQTEGIHSTTVVRGPATDQHVRRAKSTTVSAKLSHTAQVGPLMLSLRSDRFNCRVLCDYVASVLVAYHK